MATTRTPKPSTPKPSARKVTPTLPAALAKRAKEQHAARLARLAALGRAAIARIRERETDIAASVVDIGLALAELKVDGMAEALERDDFAQVCALDVGMSVVTANGFIELATRVSRETVKFLGLDRARAALDLLDALGEARAIDEILKAPVKLLTGRTIDLTGATAQEIKDAAKEVRAAKTGDESKRSMGFTTTPSEKRAYRDVQRRFEELGGAGSSQLVATRDGKGAKVRFEVRLTELTSFADALRKALRG